MAKRQQSGQPTETTETDQDGNVAVMDDAVTTNPILDDDAPTPHVGMDVVYTLARATSPLKSGEKRAAKITHVWQDGTVTLAVFVGDPRDFQANDQSPPPAVQRFVLPLVVLFKKHFDRTGAEDTWTTP